MPREGTTADSTDVDASSNTTHLKTSMSATRIRSGNLSGHTVSATSAFRKSTRMSPFGPLVIERISPNDYKAEIGDKFFVI